QVTCATSDFQNTGGQWEIEFANPAQCHTLTLAIDCRPQPPIEIDVVPIRRGGLEVIVNFALLRTVYDWRKRINAHVAAAFLHLQCYAPACVSQSGSAYGTTSKRTTRGRAGTAEDRRWQTMRPPGLRRIH